MGNTATTKKEPATRKARGGPKPATLLGYIYDYLSEKGMSEGDEIKSMVDALRNDIVEDALKDG